MEGPCPAADWAPSRHAYSPWAYRGTFTGVCVSTEQYDQVTPGMTREETENLFGTSGKLASGSAGGYTRQYRACVGSGGTEVFVTYDTDDLVVETSRG